MQWRVVRISISRPSRIINLAFAGHVPRKVALPSREPYFGDQKGNILLRPFSESSCAVYCGTIVYAVGGGVMQEERAKKLLVRNLADGRVYISGAGPGQLHRTNGKPTPTNSARRLTQSGRVHMRGATSTFVQHSCFYP